MAGVWLLRGLAASLAVSAVMATLAASPAEAWDRTPEVSCNGIQIDPATWIKVTFTGTLNGAAFTRTAFYGGDGSHNAHVSIADLTGKKHSAHVVVTASSPFFGTSHTADVTLDCSGVQTLGAPVPHGSTAGPAAAEDAAVAGTGSPSGLLPFTGAELLTLTLVALAMVTTGICASRVRARRDKIRHDGRQYAVVLPAGTWRMPARNRARHWSTWSDRGS
jgi:hypothetical protein